MRVGLVLGAGGVLGGAWLVGALHALATETGWDPGSAEYVVGTSAGAMIAGLSASGVPPWFMLAHSAGETREVDDAEERAPGEACKGQELVICLNPTSSLHAPRPRTLAERAAALLREASGRRLGSEAKRVRASGTEVILIQPTVQDLDAMGTNLMSAKRRNQVIEVAVQTVADHLRAPEIRARLSELPPGDPMLVRRPRGPLIGRPQFDCLARRRWVAAKAS